MNNISKMRRSNSKIRKWLFDNGYYNIHFFPHMRFQKGASIDDEEFDGLCCCDTQLVLFQCKSNEKISKKLLEKYRNIAKKYGIKCLFLSNFDRIGVVCYQ